jgi:AcrR family transcriptional regulator
MYYYVVDGRGQMESRAELDPTAEKLLAAAEEAFARSGIEGASVRQINSLANQKNTSAVRYHFGSKEGLLESLIERRMGALELERAEALALLDENSADPSVEDLIRVLVLPLAERVVREPGWGCWVRVLEQLVSVRGQSLRPFWRAGHNRTTREIFRRLRIRLERLPEPLWRQRTSDLMTWATASLCERARIVESGVRPALGNRAYLDNLVLTTSRAMMA